MELRAFHNDPAVKEKYLGRVREHRLADEIVHGLYWENGKGCAVGCTVHSGSHAAYEKELGIPRILARLEDRIFESLSNGEAKLFPEQFLDSIAVGADLSKVADRFLHWLLVDPISGVQRYARTDEGRRAIERVGDLYARKIAGENVERREWIAARDNCWTVHRAAAAADAYADAYAADAAAYAAYAAAAADAADAAAYAAAYAAADAAAAADADAARLTARQQQRDKLLELLREAV